MIRREMIGTDDRAKGPVDPGELWQWTISRGLVPRRL
jgi:hypothetical protein